MQDPGARSVPPRSYAALFLAFAVAAIAVYARALRGGFVSDDIGYVLGNPYIHGLTASNLLAILDPLGPAAAHTANYAPVHLLLHALGWQLFGADVLGHHLVNVVLHAGVSTLLAAFFVRTGASFAAAAAAAALFLVHPANVEAVAWIFQLKTIVSVGLAVGALLLESRRPGIACALFGLALLTKIHAAFALPVAAVLIWTDAPGTAPSRVVRARWLALWTALLAVVLVPELFAFERLGHAALSAPDGPAEQVRWMGAIAGRYLVMATTSWGVSAFHQPDASDSWLDPWFLLGGASGVAIAARAIWALRRRRVEAACWVWAVAAFVPVSQLLPFLYPMGDRYLYAVLPGLLGAGLCALHGALGDAGIRRVAALLAAGVILAFGVRSAERARIWQSDVTLSIDAAAHYPDGIPANMLRAHGAAMRGEVDVAVTALRAAHVRGFDRFMDLMTSPVFQSLRNDPGFRQVLREIAGGWMRSVEGRTSLTASELRVLGLAHVAREEWSPAVERLEQAVAAGAGAEAQQELSRARELLRAAERARPGADGEGGGDGAAAP